MESIQRRIWLERAGLLHNDFLIEDLNNLKGSVSGAEAHRAVGHFSSYIGPYLSSEAMKDAKKKLAVRGNVSKVPETTGEQHSPGNTTHELNTKHENYPKGEKVEVTGIHHIDDSGKIHLRTANHGVIPQSKIKKPESLKRENTAKTGLDVEKRVATNLGSKPAGSSMRGHDFSYNGKKSTSGETPVVRGKTKVVGGKEPATVAGESKLTNVKMGAGTVKWHPVHGWNFSSKNKEFEKHIREHAKVEQSDGTSIGLIEHLNKHHSNGVIDKPINVRAPRGSARSYLRGGQTNTLHIHNKKTDRGTTFTVGNRNELKNKTNLGHLSDKDIDDKLDGKFSIETSKTGSASAVHRPNERNMKDLAAKSQTDPKNHRDLSNAEHAGEFMQHIDAHIEKNKK
jgi:hypothetical protein